MTIDELYDDYLNSLEERKYKPIMCHLPSDIRMANKFFEGYLTSDELCERQYAGRFWIIYTALSGQRFLYILIDNNIFLEISSKTYDVLIFDKRISTIPDELRGYHYD